MTKDQFDKQAWKSGMQCKIDNLYAQILSIDFETYTIYVLFKGTYPQWVKCEKITLIK